MNEVVGGGGGGGAGFRDGKRRRVAGTQAWEAGFQRV